MKDEFETAKSGINCAKLILQRERKKIRKFQNFGKNQSQKGVFKNEERLRIEI